MVFAYIVSLKAPKLLPLDDCHRRVQHIQVRYLDIAIYIIVWCITKWNNFRNMTMTIRNARRKAAHTAQWSLFVKRDIDADINERDLQSDETFEDNFTRFRIKYGDRLALRDVGERTMCVRLSWARQSQIRRAIHGIARGQGLGSASGALPEGSVAARRRAGIACGSPEEIEADVWFCDWTRGGSLLEDARHLKQWDQTVALIWFEDEEVPSETLDRRLREEEETGLAELDGIPPWPG
jgi:hypothetical protein